MARRPNSSPLPLADRRYRATVAAGFVTGMVSGLKARRLDPLPLLRSANVPAGCLTDVRVRVPIGDYVALYNAVVRALDDEAFGLFPAPLPAGTFEFLCRAMVEPGSLGAALGRGARFLRLVLPDLAVVVTRSGPAARLEVIERRALAARAADPRRVFAFEWLLRLLHGLACWLVGRAVPLASVRFPFPRPVHAADYALVYTEHSQFGGASLVATLDAALLDLPVVREARDVQPFLDGAPGKIALLYRRDRELARQVRELLARSLADGPGLDEVARHLGLAPRTLHRRLREEGSSFRAVKDGLRREVALARVEKTRKSIARIAADLGYAEPSAFFRAFTAWTGESPSAHRKRLRPRTG